MSKRQLRAAESPEEAILRMARGERPLYALFHTLWYNTYATIAVTLSVQTNAHHTR